MNLPEPAPTPPSPRLVIATILRADGTTGVHTHVRELQAYLRTNADEATLVTPFSWARPLAVPVFAARLAFPRAMSGAGVAWYRYWHELFLREALRKRLAGMDGALVYAQGPEAAQAALKARRSPRQRIVMAVHYQYSQAGGWANRDVIKRDGSVFKSILRMERAVIPRLDGIVYVSRSAKENLLSWIPEASGVPSAVIANFAQRIDARDTSQLADLVSVGTLERDKNHEFLLQVLACARDSGRPLTLDIYGEGSLRPHLEGLAKRLGIGPQVRLPGYQPRVRELLPRYRAYVHASAVETGPLAVIEAMGAGLPVVATAGGGVPELMTDGVEGCFWDVSDPRVAAKTVVDFVDDEERRRNAAASAKERFRRSFDSTIVVPQLLAFLSSVAGPVGSSSAG